MKPFFNFPIQTFTGVPPEPTNKPQVFSQPPECNLTGYGDMGCSITVCKGLERRANGAIIYVLDMKYGETK